MTIEPVVNQTAAYSETVKTVTKPEVKTDKGADQSSAAVQLTMSQSVSPAAKTGASDEQGTEGRKQPAEHTIKSAVNQANEKARIKRTGCQFIYHEETKRISLKLYDKETKEVIKEIPPEETLEMVEKMWEMAGILVDEKR